MRTPNLDHKRLWRAILAGIPGAILGAVLFAGGASAQKNYDPGASDSEIRIGNTMPYSGNVSAYGVVGKTIAAFFRMINDTGGINGRRITFISYDDTYSPPKTVEMVRKLVEEDQILLLFYTLGTAPNTAIQKYLNAKKVPQLFVATGASKWGKPQEFPWTMGWQPNYATEAAVYAKHILATSSEPRIAILMQNDDMGKDYVAGFKAGLGQANEKFITQIATFEPADPTIDNQIIALKASGADYFINIATPKFAAQAIRKIGDLGWKPVHYLANVSASIGAVMRPAGLDNAQGVITAHYAMDTTDPKWNGDPDVARYRSFMQAFMPGADLGDQNHSTSYTVAHVMLEVLKRAGDDLTRANVMKQATSLQGFRPPLLLPGITVNTSPTDFFPLQSVQLARLTGEAWVLFGDVLTEASP